MRLSEVMTAAVLGLSLSVAFNQAAAADPADGPYKVVNTAKVGGEGGFDYVAADPDTRHLYVVRSAAGRAGLGLRHRYLETRGRNPRRQRRSWRGDRSQDGPWLFQQQAGGDVRFQDLGDDQDHSCRRKPGRDFLELSTDRVYVLSHSSPNVTAINTADGSIAGTIDLGGAPKQGASDGKGHAYICWKTRDRLPSSTARR